MTRAVLFVFERATSGNMGDRKPLAILSILVARFSKDVIHLLFPNDQMRDYRFFPGLAQWMIGDQWRKRFQIHILPDLKDREVLTQRSFCLGLSVVNSPNAVSRFGINLDFGDNDPSDPSMRFVSCFLSKFRMGAVHFGSLYLPIHREWSDASVIEKLKTFRSSQRVLGIAGSQTPPVKLNELIKWHVGSDWGVVLVGYSTEIARHSESKKIVKWLRDPRVLVCDFYVEFEDLVKYIDFYICNGGAGSVMAGIAAGCPQICGAFGSVGLDKRANCESVSRWSMGPDRTKWNFALAMSDVELHLHEYREHAHYARKIVQRETKSMFYNLKELVPILQDVTDLEPFGIGNCE